MKSIIKGFLFLQFFCACNNGEEGKDPVATSENDIDAARNFIRSALDGDYRRARTFIVSDSANNQFLDAAERNYQLRMNGDNKRGYRESSINIHSINQLNDSNSIVHYSNSYKKKEDSLKVVRTNNQWLVDLKYSFPSSTPASQ